MTGTSTSEIWVPAVRPPHDTIPASLRRRWRWVVIVGLVGLIVGASMATRTELMYSAKARLRLLGERSTPVDSRPGGDENSTIRAQYFVLRSPRILEQAAQELGLPAHWNATLADAALRLGGMVEARKLLDANVTELKVTSTSPEFSAAAANAIVDTYLTQANQPRVEQSQLMLERLRQECDAQTELLRQAESETLALRQQVGMSIGDNQYSMASLNGLRQVLVQAEASLIEARIRSESITRAGDDVVLALQKSSPLDSISQGLANRLISLETKIGELERRYGAGHPQVQKASAEYQEVMRTAEGQAVRLSELVDSDRSAAEVRATQARQRLSEAATTLIAAGGSYGQLLAAQHREETLRNLTRLLTDRAQKLEVEMNLTGPAADVIELATVPAIPEIGTPLQVATMATGIGILLGLVVAITLDRLDGRLRGAEEVEWQLNVTLLGTVGSVRSMIAPARGGPQVESYRMLRNSIDFADHTLRTLCLTSAAAQEGTSTTVANLAWTWAEHGARVLIIDANFRRPSMHRHLGLPNTAGLSEFLLEQRSLNELIQPSKVPNVSLLSAGKITGSRSATAISPQSMSELLLWARARADVILFDTAPLLASSDTSIVARQADATVLIARQQWTPTRNLRRAVHMLANCGEGLLGVILTAAPASASWDPIMNESEDASAEAGESAITRTAVSRQRKRTRHAA